MKRHPISFTWTIILNTIVVLDIILMLLVLQAAGKQAAGRAAEGDSLSITAISPNSGPVTGGTPIRVSGTDISNGATLTIKGIAAVKVDRVEDNLITAVTPAAATPGPADVTVSLPNGKSVTLAGGFTYTTNQTPAPPTTAQFIPFQ